MSLEYKRHTLAHLLAAAVRKHFPDAKFTLGPAIENGFYYDIDFGNEHIKEQDLKKIEKTMRKILPNWKEFSHKIVTESEARDFFSNNPYKLELIDDIVARGEEITLYSCGGGDNEFTDLCQGGHSEHPNVDIDTNSFCLDFIAGAYWRGSEKNPMLSRIYGLAFETKEELDQYKLQREEARKNDHRLLGQQLEIFTVSEEVGAGLPLYLPNGATIRRLLEAYCYQEAKHAGYQYVYTPHIGKSDIFARSGHLDHYADSMYAPIDMINLKGDGVAEDGKIEKFYLKPMNCPMHHQIYLHKPRSYKELPIRLYEYGTVYRYEDSGTLTGMIRVRGFTQNDAHVYCMTSQLTDVIGEAVTRFKTTYSHIGITDYSIRFSLPDFENEPEKFGEETKEWRDAVSAMRNALDTLGIEYYDGLGEAAFYGPKIDFQVKNVNGKEDTLSTIQVDYSIAPKFDITYTNQEGGKETPVIIHMALMGSVDRFMAFMLEMTGGRLPAWIAPTQIKIIPVNDTTEVLDYVKEITSMLSSQVMMTPLKYNELRYSIDDSKESLGKRIRKAETEKVPYIMVVGPKDIANKTVNIRSQNKEETIPLHSLAEKLDTRDLS